METGCAAASVIACCSSRSAPNSSSLTGALSFQGGSQDLRQED